MPVLFMISAKSLPNDKVKNYFYLQTSKTHTSSIPMSSPLASTSPQKHQKPSHIKTPPCPSIKWSLPTGHKAKIKGLSTPVPAVGSKSGTLKETITKKCFSCRLLPSNKCSKTFDFHIKIGVLMICTTFFKFIFFIDHFQVYIYLKSKSGSFLSAIFSI